VVGLYLNPPERAIVFSFDEKTQVQALDRTQPSLPMKPGRAGTMTHGYKRHGTTDLFAAMNVGTGEVLYDTKKSHTAKDVVSFFKLIDLHVPPGLEVHVILDNLSADKAELVTTWLEQPQAKALAPSFHPHLVVVAEPGRGLVLHPHPTAAQEGHLHLARRPDHRYRDLGRALERRPHAIRVEEDGRRDRGQGAPRASGTDFGYGPLTAPMGESACAGRHLFAGGQRCRSGKRHSNASHDRMCARKTGPFAIARLLLVTMDGWHQSAPM
jgi:hypothetical protein